MYGLWPDEGLKNGKEATHGERDRHQVAGGRLMCWFRKTVRLRVAEVTYYRWRSEYGGLKGNQVKRLKELETENKQLRRAVSDLTLEKLILKEAASGNW
jgi:putative transposase